jgi:hypothetical protein
MKKLSLLLIAVLSFFVACGPSVEGEQKAWDQNTKLVESLKAEYPVYAPLIDVKFTEAQKVWEAAKTVSDEKQKAEQMQQANNFMEAGCLNVLRNLKSNINQLKRDKDDLLKTSAPDYTFTANINNAVDEANNALDVADNSLYRTGTIVIADAETQLIRVGTKLDDASRSVKSVKEAMAKFTRDQKAKQNSTTQTQNGTTTNTTTESNTTTQQAAQVKCEYCGTMNDAGVTKCKNCGAPMPSK